VKTLQGFVNFCYEQPKDKQIVHAVWGKCAVGEYVNGYTSDNGPEHQRAYEFATQVLSTDIWEMLWTKRPKTYEILTQELKTLGYSGETQ